MLKNDQAYLKNLAVFTPQGFGSMFDYFSILCLKGLNIIISEISHNDISYIQGHFLKCISGCSDYINTLKDQLDILVLCY